MSLERWRYNIRRALFLAGVSLLAHTLFAGNSMAEDAVQIRELENRLKENSRIMEKLAERIRDLENKGMSGVAEAAPVPAGAQSAGVVATVTGAQADIASVAGFLDEVTWLHGFADVGLKYSGHRQDEGQKRKGFSVGALDLFLNPQLGSRVKSLVELIFEVNDEGETMAELERIQIGYVFGDYLTLWGGRYHTPLGYWNTAFHHGKQIQTAVSRPKFLNFEEDDGIIPTHMVGLWGAGSLRAGGGKLNYNLYVANGPKIGGVDGAGKGRLDPNTFSDDNHDLALGFNVGYEFPGVLDGLKLGVHGLSTQVNGYNSQGGRLNHTGLNILGGYGVYTADDWEVIGEFYQFLNRDHSLGRGYQSSSAGFLQAGRLIGRLTPYARFEYTAIDLGDQYFNSLKQGHSYRRVLGGIRFDLTPKTALKLEGSHTRISNRDRDDYFEISSQFAVRF